MKERCGTGTKKHGFFPGRIGLHRRLLRLIARLTSIHASPLVSLMNVHRESFLYLTEEDRIYKTYSTGTAAAQVHYEGNELRIIDDSDEESPQSPQESVKGLSVKVVSLKPHASRTATYKKTANRGKILSSQVRPRSVGTTEDMAGKSTEEEAIQISVNFKRLS